MSDEELVQVFVAASTRRIRRIASIFGGAAFLLIALGILGAVVITPMLGVLAGLGGTLLLPALYVSRRMNHLIGPTSPLATLMNAPTEVRDAEIAIASQRGVREESLKVTTSAGTAHYPVAFRSTYVDDAPAKLIAAPVTPEALHAAVRRRAGLPV